MDPIATLFPEIHAGGFSRVDGTIAFYARVNALLAERASRPVVLDYGAGRGLFLDDPVLFRRDLRRLQGKAGKVIGLDIDDAVLRNPSLDEAHVIAAGDPFPISDESIDLIVSDFTFEHVSDPAWVTAELDRVLKAGGWLCARSPNRWGYIAMGARAIPNILHTRVLRHLQPSKKAEDTFPTRYRMNTPKDLRAWFPINRYDHFVYAADSDPAYVGTSVAATRAFRLVFAVTPRRYRSMLYIFLRKTNSDTSTPSEPDNAGTVAEPIAR
jgi:SAM-dependent methyltransferase